MTRNALRKEQVRDFLRAGDYTGLLGWATAEPGAQRALLSLLHDHEESIRWRAAEALGRLAARIATQDLEAVRNLIRILFWSMNDESGNLIRFAPQALGEILFHVPELHEEYLGQLSSFLVESPFEEGTAWALERIADRNRASASEA